ncbi:hypothetical protein [Chitinasiproducens palmae]|uniref:YqjK-like protein n=1 Tax=Chitinasiproducens palmae TaxID=1770053 RepID=A0A1H2PNG4_9BURK|nr:hypothetical protein [Chitinasiproducens palmae]SDV47720.1 hypothetical protein SAMN05216551_103245 [Chitinasiproducens palmae]
MSAHAAGYHPKDDKHKKKESIAVRRERLLDQIELERIEMRHAALTLVSPLRRIDQLRSGGAAPTRLLYPLAPVAALLALKFRPSLRTTISLAGRAFALWRLIRRLRS